MKKNKKIVGLGLIAAILVLGVGYAAVTNNVLTITGTSNINDAPINVVFDETTGNEPTGVATVDVSNTTSNTLSATASVDATDKTKATFTISNFEEKGDKVTLTYYVRNNSSDKSVEVWLNPGAADYSAGTNLLITSSANSTSKLTIGPGESKQVTVTVELESTPTDSTAISSTLKLNADVVTN